MLIIHEGDEMAAIDFPHGNIKPFMFDITLFAN